MVDFRVEGSASLDPDHIIESVDMIIEKLDELHSKIDELDLTIDRLSGKTIDLAVNIDGEDKLDFLRGLLDDLDAKTYVVDIRVDVNGEDKIEELKLKADEMDAKRHTFGIDIDLQGAGRATTELVALDEELNHKEDDFNKAKSSSNGFSFSLMSLLPLLTAVIPIAAAAGGGVVALAGAFATMAPGLLGIALAAKPAFAEIQKLTKSLDQNTKNALANASGYDQIYKILNKNSAMFRGMSGDLQGLVVGWFQLQNAYSRFQKAVDPAVFPMLEQGLELLRKLLSGLPALVNPAASALQNMILDFENRLKSPAFQQFFSDMKKNTYTFVSDFSEGILNIIEGLTALFHAFMPVSLDISNGFLNMTASFDRWAQSLSKSKGFQQFIDYIKANGPVVLDTLKQLGLLLFNVGAALSGMGAGSLGIIDHLLTSINNFAKTNPVLFKLAATLLLVGIAGSKLLPIIGPLLSFLATPVGAIVAVLIAVGAGFVYAYTHSKAFRDWVNTNLLPMWDKIVQAAQQFVTWIKGLWPDIIQIWNKYGQTFMALVKNLWNLIGNIFLGAVKVIEGIVEVFLGLLTGNWSKVWDGIKKIASGIWQAVKSIFTDGVKAVGDIFSGLGEILYNIGKSIIQGLWNGMKSVWNDVTNWLSGLGNWISNLKGPIEKDATLLTPHGKAIIGGLMDGMQSQVGPLENQLKGFAKTIQSAFGDQYSTDISTRVSATLGEASGTMANYQRGGRLPSASGSQVTFAAGAIVVNNPKQEQPGITLTRVLQGAAKFGTIQAPVGYTTGT